MPQAQDLLEKLAEILLYNFNREHILLKLKIKSYCEKLGLKTYQLEFSRQSANTFNLLPHRDAFANRADPDQAVLVRDA